MKNVLLLGDSIRKGYDSYTQKHLEGKANVFFPEDNGRFAQYFLRYLSEWTAQLQLDRVDVIHWNAGLWDILHMSVNGIAEDGETDGTTFVPPSNQQKLHFEKDPVTPPEFYRYFIGRIQHRIEQLFPNAVSIFAATTPVLVGEYVWAFRSNEEVEQYNRIAEEVLRPRGVIINDLYTFSKEHCGELHQDWVHYNEQGCDVLGKEVADFITPYL